MANIFLKNGWNEAKAYYNVASVSFPAVEGGEAVYYENASGGGGSDGLGAQADWNENNPNQASYIKNRPFYVYYEPIYQSNLVQFTINSISKLYEAVIRISQPIIENKSYVVYWHDTGYLCTATKINNEIYLGDLSLVDTSYAQEDPEPFVAFYDNTTNSIVFSTSSEEEYRIVGLFDGEEQVQKLDKKFLPSDIAAEADWSATKGQPGFINNKPDLNVYAEKAVIAETLKSYETTESAETRIENVTKKFNETLKDYETTQAVNKKVETLNQEIAKRAIKTEVDQAFQDTQADWNIEDESNLASIRNKPFGNIPDLLSNVELTFVLNEETGLYEAETGLVLEPGINYVVTWNEEEVLCQVGVDNGHFLLTEQGVFTISNPVENPVVTLRKEDNVYRIDKKYLPVNEILEGIASEDYVGEQIKAIPKANWAQTNQNEPDYIRNKPTIPSIAGLASEQYVKQAVADSQADWENIDIGDNRYVAHKPFGTMPLYFSEEKDYNFTYNSYRDISRSEEAVEGLNSYRPDKIYVFYFDGIRYELKYETYTASDGYTMYCFGNPYLVGRYYQLYFPDNKLPFGCGMDDHFYVKDNQKTHRIAYYSLETEEKLLDAKWLPSTVASTAYVNNYVNQKIEESAAGTQSDWNSIDASSTSFIKNRPFGYVQDLLANHSFICQQGAAMIGNLCFSSNSKIYFEAEETYIVTWDGVEYELVAYKTSFNFPAGFGFSNAVFLGNQKIVTDAGASSEQPLPYESDVPFYMGNGFLFMKNNSQNLTTQYTLSIRLKNNYQKIKLSDLPDEVINIKPDWEQTDPEAPDYIQNKPTLFQKQANWAQTDKEAPDYIQNKPTIPSLPVYSQGLMNYKGMHLVYTGEEWDGIRPDAPDWQITNNLDSRYIHNKPFGEVGEIIRIEEFMDDPVIISNHTAHFYGDTAFVYFDIGKTYQINITGQIYTSVCRELDREDLDFAVYFGNGKIAADILSQEPVGGAVDTGENYAIIILGSGKGTSDQSTIIILLQRGEYPKQTLSISSKAIKKIDKKFLPDECFDGSANHEQISALEKLVQAQSELINQMQQQIQDLTQRVENLEQGYTPPSGPGASVNGDTLEIEGSVTDETLAIQGGTVSNETLALSGGNGSQAEVEGEELIVNGSIVNEVLNLGSGAIIGETLELAESTNVVIEETVSTTGTINDDILTSSGVVTASEIWEVK